MGFTAAALLRHQTVAGRHRVNLMVLWSARLEFFAQRNTTTYPGIGFQPCLLLERSSNNVFNRMCECVCECECACVWVNDLNERTLHQTVWREPNECTCWLSLQICVASSTRSVFVGVLCALWLCVRLYIIGIDFHRSRARIVCVRACVSPTHVIVVHTHTCENGVWGALTLT